MPADRKGFTLISLGPKEPKEPEEPKGPDAFEIMALDLREAQVQRRMKHVGADEEFWTPTEKLIASQWLLFQQASQTLVEESESNNE